ncbi:MAG: MBL fold metallo-hydrolase [Verrucomicrobia bacterium]|nr:MBL fold metallo-hydrolase [Verrucomicrobiota bacterium]
MILEIFCSGPAFTNSVLLGCTRSKKAAIIDAPLGSGDILIERVEAFGLDLEMLLLTHSHWDHFADMSYLKKKMRAPLYVHELDAPNLKKPGADHLPLLVPIQAVEPTGFLTDGQIIMLGELRIEVIHTPGHSPGSVCFYLPEKHTLISGDTLFQGSMGNVNFPTSNPDKMWESLALLSKLPASTRVIPGHGDETTIGAESWISNAKEYFGE